MGCFALRSFYMKGVFSALGNPIDVALQGSPRSRTGGKALDAAFTDTLDGDDEGLGDTIQDTLNISDAAQLREDAKFHHMSRYVCRVGDFQYFRKLRTVKFRTKLDGLKFKTISAQRSSSKCKN